MASDMPTALIVVVVIVFGYPIVCTVVLRLTEGTRMAFADRARILLVDHTVTEEQKLFISSMVDDVFDWRFMAFATVLFPFAAFSHVDDDLTPDERQFFERADVRELVDLHMKCVMAVSPFFTVLFFLVALVCMIGVICVAGLSMLNLVWAETVKAVSPRVGHGPKAMRFVNTN